MEIALEAKELDLQTLRGSAAENFTLRTEASLLIDFVETLVVREEKW